MSTSKITVSHWVQSSVEAITVCITYMYFGGGRKSIADWPVCFVLKQKISYIDLHIPISVTLTEIHVPALIFYKDINHFQPRYSDI